MYTSGQKDFTKPGALYGKNIPGGTGFGNPISPALIPSSIPAHDQKAMNGSSLTPNTYSAPPSSAPMGSVSASSAPNPVRLSEVKLYNNSRERENYDHMADLYSIIRTTEALERAYARDAINAEDYKKQCFKLITQFEAALELAKDIVPDIRKFIQDYKLEHCKVAVVRLIDEKIPRGASAPNDTARIIAETVQHFITAMDNLKLNLVAVDQMQPLLQDLYDTLCKIPSLAPDWEGKVKLKNWLVVMKNMKAHESLDESQARQLSFDLDQAYNRFHKSLA